MPNTKRSPLRFRVATMLTVIGLAAVALAIDVARRRADMDRQRREDCLCSAEIHRQRAANAERYADAIRQIAEDYKFSQMGNLRGLYASLSGLAEHHKLRAEKYESAADHPWEALEPDPPPPWQPDREHRATDAGSPVGHAGVLPQAWGGHPSNNGRLEDSLSYATCQSHVWKAHMHWLLDEQRTLQMKLDVLGRKLNRLSPNERHFYERLRIQFEADKERHMQEEGATDAIACTAAVKDLMKNNRATGKRQFGENARHSVQVGDFLAELKTIEARLDGMSTEASHGNRNAELWEMEAAKLQTVAEGKGGVEERGHN